VQAHFVGSLNPRLESAHYLQSIASLLEHYRYELQYPLDRSSESSENRITEVVPLIVNTQGWVKGLGADLLDQIEAMVEATHTFTFNSNGGENGDADEMRVFTGEDYELPSERTLSMGYGTVVPLESAPASGLFSRFSPADSRTLSTIAYLHARLQGDEHPDWDFSDALVGKLPWEVDTDDVIKEVYLSGEGSDGILADDLGLALNGSIVALVERIGDSLDLLERYSPGRVLPSPLETRCVGLGLIRAASADQSVIQLITPIAPNQLGRISIIVKGDLELPLCGSLDWKTGSANDDGLLGVAWDEVPFLSVKPERGVGMGRRRFRRNLMRKNQGN
jgi:polynucleotide 5'-hydroxyl-kinase GRC3/NOL9